LSKSHIHEHTLKKSVGCALNLFQGNKSLFKKNFPSNDLGVDPREVRQDREEDVSGGKR